jgi:hypothetical protein
MITVANRLYVKSEYAQAFEKIQRLAKGVEPLDFTKLKSALAS